MSESAQPDAKVLFRVPNEDGTADVETLWATNMGNDQYKLDNSPLYAYSVSWQDIVYAPIDADEGFPVFQRVVLKSGNRTVRVIFDLPAEPGNASDEILNGLVALGCDYEGADGTYISVNIPPDVELRAVRDYLIKCGATWEHADPTYAELHPEEA